VCHFFQVDWHKPAKSTAQGSYHHRVAFRCHHDGKDHEDEHGGEDEDGQQSRADMVRHCSPQQTTMPGSTGTAVGPTSTRPTTVTVSAAGCRPTNLLLEGAGAVVPTSGKPGHSPKSVSTGTTGCLGYCSRSNTHGKANTSHKEMRTAHTHKETTACQWQPFRRRLFLTRLAGKLLHFCKILCRHCRGTRESRVAAPELMSRASQFLLA
jgi:hypothetical protein